MKILLSNDDGVWAQGIHELASALKPFYDIAICAPDRQRSAASHSFTFSGPLHVAEVTIPGLEDIPAFSVSGTPADCVKLGCVSLVPDADMVITGINHGGNLGSDVLYSGTVGAAMEGALMGKPAIAASCNSANPKDFSAAAQAAVWAARYIQEHPLPENSLLNVNAPDIPASKIKGAKLCGLHKQCYFDEYLDVTDPRGNRYFFAPSSDMKIPDPDADKDACWCNKGYVTVTPIHFDIADYQTMQAMDISGFRLND
ncbi:MAG: 5'/3'-nucleotidase SurE [Eubacteriales bacterium]|nr:5'/3'-nucleotidase SurE [Eubacteriales bacterium]